MNSKEPVEVRPELGLPCDESPERKRVVELFTAMLVEIGQTADEAGESPIMDLRNEKDMRGLLRYMTAVDSEGGDGEYGERKQKFWRDLGEVLSRRASLSSEGETTRDTERLDWLERNGWKARRYTAGGKWTLIAESSPNARPGQPTLREAIDAAQSGAPVPTTEPKP